MTSLLKSKIFSLTLFFIFSIFTPNAYAEVSLFNKKLGDSELDQLVLRSLQTKSLISGQPMDSPTVELGSQVIVSWAYGVTMDHLIEMEPLDPQMIEAQLNLFLDSGIIPPFTNEIAQYNRAIDNGIREYLRYDNPGETEISLIYSKIQPEVPESMPLSEASWRLILVGKESENDICCWPLTEVEYKELNRKTVENYLLHVRIAESADLHFKFSESSFLKEKVGQAIQEAGLQDRLTVEEGIKKILHVREWTRYRNVVITDFLKIDDPKLREAVIELVKKEQEKLIGIDFYKSAIHLPY